MSDLWGYSGSGMGFSRAAQSGRFEDTRDLLDIFKSLLQNPEYIAARALPSNYVPVIVKAQPLGGLWAAGRRPGGGGGGAAGRGAARPRRAAEGSGAIQWSESGLTGLAPSGHRSLPQQVRPGWRVLPLSQAFPPGALLPEAPSALCLRRSKARWATLRKRRERRAHAGRRHCWGRRRRRGRFWAAPAQ